MANKKYQFFNKEYIEDVHGELYFYRDLYLGNHMNIFARAMKMKEDGEILENMVNEAEGEFAKSPYIVANVAKMIVDIPAMFVSRSIGKIDTSEKQGEIATDDAAANSITDARISGTNDETTNGVIENLQSELIKQIIENSKMDDQHRSNIVQHQIDGGLVGVPWDDDRGLRIEFKGRDIYFPHEDGLGADLSVARKIGDLQYLHVYRDRLYKQGTNWNIDDDDSDDFVAPADGLRTQHILYLLGKGGVLKDSAIESEEAAKLLKMDINNLEIFYPGRNTQFIRYMANEKTFMNPHGVSCLYGQDAKQDEINWALTRNALVFERNGKPRIAVNKELAHALQKNMVELYGEKAKGNFDSRNLEVVTMDENGNSMEIFQIDISKIGDVKWVKDLIKMMLMETRTSEKAVDFYLDSSGSAAQSGIAKFYDLFISLMKAEEILKQYTAFLKGLFKDALWLANYDDPSVVIEEPEIELLDMLPIQRKELTDNAADLYEKGVVSLETTVREMNPDWSEDRIEEELLRLEFAKVSADSSSLGLSGAQTLENLLDNPNRRPPATAADNNDPGAANEGG